MTKILRCKMLAKALFHLGSILSSMVSWDNNENIIFFVKVKHLSHENQCAKQQSPVNSISVIFSLRHQL